MTFQSLRRSRPAALLLTILILLLGAHGANSQPDGIEDPAIADAVEKRLERDPSIDLNRIDVAVELGVVELTGIVRDLLAKERAAKIAERVRGVRAVSNRIRVEPTMVLSDRGIRRLVLDALADDPATEAYEVAVRVADGVVTLSGEVSSGAERSLAERLAKGVRGVVGVSNELSVDVPDERADSEILRDVQQRLRWDVLVDAALIDVAVGDGRVELTGTVGSLAEKYQARHDAWVDGVSWVDIQGLDVDPLVGRDLLRDSDFRARTDVEIREAISDALLLDPRVGSFGIEADVDQARVTLRGEVDNLAAKHAAARLARHTVGVREVTNRIKVRPAEPRTDDALAAEIRARLERNPVVDKPQIAVSVEQGTAVLSGTVESRAERREAAAEAIAVRGVTEIENNLMAEDLSVYWKGPYYSYSDQDQLTDVYPTGVDDREIREQVRDQLFWSPDVDSEGVEVRVENGTVFLEGVVDSRRAYFAAEENAWEGGALTVRNRLRIATDPDGPAQ